MTPPVVLKPIVGEDVPRLAVGEIDLEASKHQHHDDGFLLPPRTGYIRPLSPDSVSNFSVDDRDYLDVQLPEKARPTSLSGSFKGRLKAFWIRNFGVLCMVVAQLFGCMMNITTRILEVEGNKGKGIHPFQVLFARMGITLVIASAYMWWRKTPHFPLGLPEVRWLLVVRGIGGVLGVSGMYFSLLYLPLADATVITFLAPGLSCWACSFIIKEPFTTREKLGTLVSMLGVVFIARPTTLFHMSPSVAVPPATGNGDVLPAQNASMPTIADASDYGNVTPSERLFAVGISLVGVLGATLAYTTIRWIGQRAHPLISVNYFAAWSTVVSIIMQFAMPSVGFLLPADLKDWSLLFFLGVCGFILQYLIAAGLAYEKSSRVTNMAYTQMLFALGADKVFFDTTPGVMSIFGSTLIVGSAIMMAMQQEGRSQDSDPVELPNHADEERGLMRGVRLEDEGETSFSQEVPLRTLR